MGETLEKVRRQLNEFWQGRTKSQRIKILVSAALLFASLTIAIFMTSRPEMVPLYSQLDVKDAGAIAQKLDEMKIHWEMGSSETEILVPKDEVNRLRMQLATEGLPRNGFSLIEALDNTKLGTTDMERRERIRIGQEYAIAQAIETIEGVEYAQVNLYIPQDSLFALNGKDYESSAGIILKLEPGAELSREQVKGIIQFVSKSVKGLKRENISIIDQTGRELSSNASTGEERLLEQMEIELAAQQRLQGSIKEFLETAFGKNNVDVRVSLKLDFDSKVTNIVRFEPPIPGETSGLVRSIQELEEQTTSGTTGGIPGTDSNPYENINYGEVENESSKYEKVSQIVNYELNEIKEQIVKAQGQVKSLTVAILINSNILNGELDPQQEDNIANMVAAAAGIDPNLVEIQSLPFDTSFTDRINAGFEERERLERVKFYTYAGGIAALLIAGIISSVIAVRRRRSRRDMEMLAGADVSANREELEDIDLVKDKSSAKRQVERFVDRRPEVAAQLLKTWLSEE